MKNYYVYILRNHLGTVLYIGVTNDLVRRVYEHKQKSVTGFTKKYNAGRLVYYETHESIDSAITREKQLKAWKRE
jgi:putative endonuclease